MANKAPAQGSEGVQDIPQQLPSLPMLDNLLAKTSLNILELGAGTGILSLSMAAAFPSRISRLVLTDLPEATEIISRNLEHFRSGADCVRLEDTEQLCQPSIRSCLLDWSQPLPDEIALQAWDLVTFADCTYNADVVPDLVQTLVALRTKTAEARKDVRDDTQQPLILCALKTRHESEAVFFELMQHADFTIVEKETVSIGKGGLYGDAEAVQIYVFR